MTKKMFVLCNNSDGTFDIAELTAEGWEQLVSGVFQ